MRILFINTTDMAGGAAVVMQRLNQGLQDRYKTESLILVKDKSGKATNTESILSNRFAIIFEKILNRISTPLGLLYLTFPFSSRKLLMKARKFKPDIISLHNTHGAYFATPLLTKLSTIAPVVWTLHDMWSFTGNASHTFGNMSWKYMKNDRHLTKIPPSIGINTGAWLLRKKQQTYQKSDLTIVTPSVWLADLAKQSPVFKGKKIHHIFNGLNLNIYKPTDKRIARQKLGITNDYPTIMFSSHYVDKHNPWKGGNDLLDILVKIDRGTKSPVNFLVLGEGSMTELNNLSNVHLYAMGYVKSEGKMVNCLNAADLLVYPTRADNLPNVLVESIACGTPCITFDIGGNREIIRDNFTGILVRPLDLDTFASRTLTLMEDRDQLAVLSKNCSAEASEKFSLVKMVERYYTIYEELSTNNQLVKSNG